MYCIMKKRTFTSAFKTKVVLEALSERFTIQELGQKHNLPPTQISNWKSHFLSNANGVFNKAVKDTKTQAQEKEEHFLNVIGQQNIEIDVLKQALS